MSTERNTVQRQMVLDAVRQLRCHPTADEIYSHVAQRYPSISKGTVYRNLALLANQGQIQRVSHLNAADRFDFELAPHYHFRCRGCGRVFDVDLPYKHGLLDEVADTEGFVYESCDITFTGMCPGCRKNGQES